MHIHPYTRARVLVDNNSRKRKKLQTLMRTATHHLSSSSIKPQFSLP
ncbi:hypothetical protein Hanom_Chr12g01144481 [Helianthus anomalus]